MSTPIIFPSLSRAPSLDTSVKTADDTIRDSMDLGYVATRPRFSRARRTWSANVRNLQLEDVRALDEFANVTVQRGGKSFYYPNLVGNSSFEFAAEDPSELVALWEVEQSNLLSIAVASTQALAGGGDGLSCLQFVTQNGNLNAGASAVASILCNKTFQVVPGETYQAVFSCASFTRGFAGDTINVTANLQIILQISDGTQAVVSPSAANVITAPSSEFAPVGQQFTIPNPVNGTTILGAQAQLIVTLQNAGALEITLSSQTSGNYYSVYFDSVGVALFAPAPGYTIYGRMVGSSALPFPVRFAPSKLPEFADIGASIGVKYYGSTFGLEEV